MNWLAEYKQDVLHYSLYSDRTPFGRILVPLLTEQGLWALFQYRISSAIYRSSLPWYIKRPLFLTTIIWQKIIEIVTGISLPARATIGPGLYIGHFGNIVLHPQVIVGRNCNIAQGVTIGVSGRGGKRGVPTIGDRVYIGVNAVVAGKIIIGNDAMIGPNSVVNFNVPEHTTVLGVPATIINNYGSQDYIISLDRPRTVKSDKLRNPEEYHAKKSSF